MIYLFALLILIVPYIKDGGNTVCSKKTYYLYFAVLFLISALNFGLGSDTFGFVGNEDGYYESYRSISTLSRLSSNDFQKDTWQPGFVVLFSFFKSISSNYLVYQLFHAFLINFIIFYFIRRNSPYVGLCLFFYCLFNYFDYNFEIQRESFCIVLGLLLFDFLDRNQDKRYYLYAVIIVILAFLLIHRSAFVLILIPMLKNIRITKNKILVCGVITLFIQIFWIRFSESFSLILNIVAGDVYQGYLQREFSGSTSAIYYIRLALINVIIPYICIWLSYKSGKTNILIFAMLSIAFECLADFTFAFHRMYGYFSPFYWIVMAEAFMFFKDSLLRSRPMRVIAVLFISYYIIYTYHNIYFVYDDINGQYVYERYFPYRSVLEEGNAY